MMQIEANDTGCTQMLHEPIEHGPSHKTKNRWLSSFFAIGIVGVLGLAVTGCSGLGNDNPPRPEQISQPAEAAAESGELPKGLAGDAGTEYDEEFNRDDVTVVRPLREDSKPPKVTVGNQVQEQQPSEAATVDSSGLPDQPPVLDRDADPKVAAADSMVKDGAPDSSVLGNDPNSDSMRSLDAFSAKSYGVSFLAATIPFNHGSSRLSSSDMEELRQVVAQLKDNGGVITVIGHASSRTGDMSAIEHKLANFDISVSRARSVARALRRLGAPANAIYVGAVSDNEPIYQEAMPAGEAGNRRTEVFLNQ